MRRLSKLHLVLIGVLIVALAVNVFFFYQAGKVEKKNAKLKEELIKVTRQLEGLEKTHKVSELKKKLSDLEQKVKSLQQSLKSVLLSEESRLKLTDHLVSSAGLNKVELIAFQPASKTGTVKIGNTEYRKEDFGVSVRGELKNIEKFLAAVEEEGPFAYTRVQELKLTSVEGGWEGSFKLEILSPLPQPAEKSKEKGES